MSKGKRYSSNVLRHTINRKRYKRMNRAPQKRFSPSNHSQKCSFSICAHLSEHELDFRMLIAWNRDQHNETDHGRTGTRQLLVTISHYNAAVRASGAHRWPGRAFLDGRIGECIRSGTRRRGMSWPFFFLLCPHEKISAAAWAPDRDVCTHRALRLPSYINVNAAGYRRRARRPDKESRAKRRDEKRGNPSRRGKRRT